MRGFLQLILILASLPALAQNTFIKDFSNDTEINYRLATGADAYVLLAANRQHIAKFNTCGNFVWGKNLSLNNGSDNFEFSDLITCKTGGYIACGTVNINFGDSDFIVVKIGENGNLIWSKTIAASTDQYAYSIAEDSKGNLFLLGNHASSFAGRKTVLKLNGEGNLLWARHYFNYASNSGSYSNANAIATSDDGMLGRVNNLVFKITADGELQWAKTYSDFVNYSGKPVEDDAGYVFYGRRSNTNQNIGGLLKIDKNGKTLWGGSGFLCAADVNSTLKKLPNANYLLATSLYDDKDGLNYVYLAEFSSMGKMLKQRKMNPSTSQFRNSIASDLVILPDNSLIISGYSYRDRVFFPTPKAFVAKASAAMEFSCGVYENTTIISDLQISGVNYSTLAEGDRIFTVKDLPLVLSVYTPAENTVCGSGGSLVNLGDNLSLCAGEKLVLKNTLKSHFDYYKWSTGENADSIVVTKGGLYSVKAWNTCASDTLYAQVQVSVKALNPDFSLPSKVSICQPGGSTISLNAGAQASYLWNDGSTLANYTFNKAGTYSLKISVESCTFPFAIEVEECEKLEMATLLTPNNDGKNDRLVPLIYRGIKSAKMIIFDRRGRKVFATDDVPNGWDGTQVNGEIESDTYFWVVIYKTNSGQENTIKGYTTLLK